MEEDKEQMIEKLREQEEARKAQEEKINKLMNMVVVSRSVTMATEEPEGLSKKARAARRETWCPGEGKLADLGIARGPKPFYMDKNLKKPQKKVQVETQIEKPEPVVVEPEVQQEVAVEEPEVKEEIAMVKEEQPKSQLESLDELELVTLRAQVVTLEEKLAGAGTN
jgi:hypothetical protein